MVGIINIYLQIIFQILDDIKWIIKRFRTLTLLVVGSTSVNVSMTKIPLNTEKLSRNRNNSNMQLISPPSDRSDQNFGFNLSFKTTTSTTTTFYQSFL
ncbi:hypothetical protein T10_8546 [Trichinella papuae]|uniref:Uncharacterized protein n=1 Tax=Trichinella papuae TaxID=268474 RepID=A0A0V1N3K0_9BILA|nr:hypothetical protein T10_8546 [Trichinella papuae]